MPAIKNLRVSLQTLSALGVPPEINHIVVNRSDAKAGLDVEDVESAVRRKVTARVPSSRDVPANTNIGKTIVKELPNHKVSKEIISLSDHVREFTGGRKVSAKPSLISRLKRKK
jgi:pilus assembly protein CpaE